MRAAVAVVFGAATLAAGCGGSRHAESETTTPPAKQTRAAVATPEGLKAAARDALEQNHRLSVYVLWHNELPRWAAASTRGPALSALGAAAKTRRDRGVRVRMLEDQRAIKSLELDPSYTKVTAIVVDRQRVQPSGKDGHALGQAVKLNERATYELRRLGESRRFVVWKVAPTR